MQLKNSLAEQIMLGLRALADRGRLLDIAATDIQHFVESRLADVFKEEQLPPLFLEAFPE